MVVFDGLPERAVKTKRIRKELSGLSRGSRPEEKQVARRLENVVFASERTLEKRLEWMAQRTARCAPLVLLERLPLQMLERYWLVLSFGFSGF